MEKSKPLCICCLNFKYDKKSSHDSGNEKAYCSKGLLLNMQGKNKLYLIDQQVYKNPRKMKSCRSFDDMFAFENNFEHYLDEISKEEAICVIEADRHNFLMRCLDDRRMA